MMSRSTSKVSPYDKDTEMEELPNNMGPQPEMRAVDQLRMIANVGLAAVRWEDYCNTRRKPKVNGRSTTGCGLAGDLNEETYGCYQQGDSPDGSRTTAGVIRRQMQTAPNRSLIQYLARLSDPEKMEDFIDLEFVDGLVREGADINCTDMYGQSVLHEVARTWHVDVARFLVIELEANVSIRDNWGRTPLHVAASVDYPEMCDYLIEAGADREAKTKGEEQTPVFYAARNDAIVALKHLLAKGCEFKDNRDFKKRTPLTVAAELDRSETARLLLQMGAPADVRDDSGQPVLVPLIMKMAPVAKEALNQFHQKDRANRKQYYYLGRIDPTSPEELDNRKYQTALQIIVNNQQYDLAMHSAIQRMIEVKWNYFTKWRAVGTLIFQFAYILSWSVFGVVKDWTERHQYVLPSEAWRIVIFLVAVVLTFYQIVEEIMEYRGSNKKHEEWKEWRLQEIARDEAFCHPRWPEEKEYLDQEKTDLDDMAPSYFSDAWNFFDWLCYALLTACIVSHFVDIFHHNLIIARWHIRIMAVTVILLWLRFMKVARAFSLLGPFIVILGHMISDVIKFFILYLDFYIPFALAFWMLLGGSNLSEKEVTYNTTVPANAKRIQVKGLVTFHDTLFTMFRLTLVDDYDYDNMILVDHVMSQLLVGSWLALSAILCINLFIALLSDTFVRVYDNAQANAVMQRAITILNVMEGLRKPTRIAFHRFLLTECNPESLYYDDDTSYGGDEDLKKATIEVREICHELNDKFETIFGSQLEDEAAFLLPKQNNATTKKAMERAPRTQILKPPKKPSIATQMMKNMNVVSVETFEREIESLRERMDELRTQQGELTDRVKREMAAMRSILQDVAVVITGERRPVESLHDAPESEERRRQRKKKRSRRGDDTDGGHTSRTLDVAPAAPAMQIETYSSSGGGYLPSVTLPGAPRDESEDV